MTRDRKESVAILAQTAVLEQVVHTLLGTLDATDQKRIFVAHEECYVKDVALISETALAVAATNFRSFQVKDVTNTKDLMAAAVDTDTGGVAIVADTPYYLTPDQNNKLAKGDVLELDMVKNGTAASLVECSVAVTVTNDPADSK